MCGEHSGSLLAAVHHAGQGPIDKWMPFIANIQYQRVLPVIVDQIDQPEGDNK